MITKLTRIFYSRFFRANSVDPSTKACRLEDEIRVSRCSHRAGYGCVGFHSGVPSWNTSHQIVPFAILLMSVKLDQFLPQAAGGCVFVTCLIKEANRPWSFHYWQLPESCDKKLVLFLPKKLIPVGFEPLQYLDNNIDKLSFQNFCSKTIVFWKVCKIRQAKKTGKVTCNFFFTFFFGRPEPPSIFGERQVCAHFCWQNQGKPAIWRISDKPTLMVIIPAETVSTPKNRTVVTCECECE